MILLAGALLGFVAVAFGAYAEHGLRGDVSEEMFHSVTTALRLNQVHAVVSTAIGLAVLWPAGDGRLRPGRSALSWAAGLFVLGTILFSFTIYSAAVWGIPALTRAAPLGGVTLMAGWLALAWVGLRSLNGRSADGS